MADALLALAETAEALKALETAAAELLKPSNDPHYLRKVLANEKDRAELAKEIIMVHHTRERGRNYLSVGLRDPRNTALAATLAEILQRHFEAPLCRHEDPHDLTRFADRIQKQPPKHEFGREKRSKR